MSEKVEKKAVKEKPAKVSKYAGKGTRVTVPMFKLNAGDVVAFEFGAAGHAQFIGKPSSDGKFTDPASGKKYDKDAATMYRVTNMDTGEVVDLIAPKVLVSSLDRLYPGDKLKGKKLVLECGQREDKKYLDVSVSEL